MKSILLIITGSVASYKALEVIRLLKDKDIAVTCVLTKGGEEFVTPLACSSLTGNKTYTHLFSLTDETEMGHIRLSRENDLVVVAPATADMLAKMAGGIADDLATTLLLATDKPVLVAPAMNIKMWQHPAVKRNVKQLKDDSILFVGPESGDLACGEEGFGRLSEPEEIVQQIENSLRDDGKKDKKSLDGKRILITSGPTVEAIDPVRYITNRSSGKQGHALATSFRDAGAKVILVSGPTALPVPDGVEIVKVESARDMLEACYKALPVDVAVCAAAVSDWRVTEYVDHKIKKNEVGEDLAFTFMENPDILECISKHEQDRPALVIGFAAETENLVENAKAKLARKGCDWILANNVSGGDIFGSDDSTIHFITHETEEGWASSSKLEVANKLTRKIVDFFNDNKKLELVRSTA